MAKCVALLVTLVVVLYCASVTMVSAQYNGRPGGAGGVYVAGGARPIIAKPVPPVVYRRPVVVQKVIQPVVITRPVPILAG
ncbi:hypothetical protein AND_006256 [Anopheles darlingi]|uniref:Secreted protein n=1 Tax=Anopheles darlingi TaxID=43151 RepID=W5JGM7_ANODA|nr:hypothetical protein AND_006256 [Anopheles darlingi]